MGNQNGSFKTPLGLHSIAQKIGEGLPINEVFVGRQPLGVLQELMDTGEQLPDDIITSRILWLQGEEEGVNKQPYCDINQIAGGFSEVAKVYSMCQPHDK